MHAPPYSLSDGLVGLKRYFAKPQGWLAASLSLWFGLLILFYLFPGIDLAVARAFFSPADCGTAAAAERSCGSFPYGRESLYIVIRQVLFYLPAVVGFYVLYRLIMSLRRHGFRYMRATRDYLVAFAALLLGPYVLVNVILKQISNRPRPYETDLFGGHMAFTPAGDFSGACVGNCSFISGEAAGAGWMACLIVLLPKELRVPLGLPLIVISMISPALRTAFGGHYLSDVTLGWLSSVVVYAAVATCFEMSQRRRKAASQTVL